MLNTLEVVRNAGYHELKTQAFVPVLYLLGIYVITELKIISG